MANGKGKSKTKTKSISAWFPYLLAASLSIALFTPLSFGEVKPLFEYSFTLTIRSFASIL
jgi:hypothetical protein